MSKRPTLSGNVYIDRRGRWVARYRLPDGTDTTSIVPLIYQQSLSEYEAYDKLVKELRTRESLGLTQDLDEIRDAIDALNEDFAQRAMEVGEFADYYG